MLFTAFERTALAELLAAAWIPLLLLRHPRHRPPPSAHRDPPSAPLANQRPRRGHRQLHPRPPRNPPRPPLTPRPTSVLSTARPPSTPSSRPGLSWERPRQTALAPLPRHHLPRRHPPRPDPPRPLPPPRGLRTQYVQTHGHPPQHALPGQLPLHPTTDAAHNSVNHTISLLAHLLLLTATCRSSSSGKNRPVNPSS